MGAILTRRESYCELLRPYLIVVAVRSDYCDCDQYRLCVETTTALTAAIGAVAETALWNYC